MLIETSSGDIGIRRAGAGEPLLLLHGGFSDSRAWTPQLDALADAFDVIAWDAPGCGASFDPVGTPALGEYAEAAHSLVQALDVGPVHVVGHSFGSGLAIALVEQHPADVRSLILSGAYAGWRGSLPVAEVRARVERGLADLDRPAVDWIDSYLPEFLPEGTPHGSVDLARAMMLDARPAGVRSMLLAFADADLRPALASITVPTLLIHGADDVRSSRPVVDAIHDAIPGSILEVVPGTGHDVNLAAPDAFNARVRAFVGGLPRPPVGEART